MSARLTSLFPKLPVALAEQAVTLDRCSSLGTVVLSRPSALNSLNLPMIRALTSSVLHFASDPSIGSILLTGAGEKAFCAGGDVRIVVEEARRRGSLSSDDEDLSDAFFREVCAFPCVHPHRRSLSE